MACCAHLCPGREVCQIGWGGRGCCGGIAVELEERGWKQAVRPGVGGSFCERNYMAHICVTKWFRSARSAVGRPPSIGPHAVGMSP